MEHNIQLASMDELIPLMREQLAKGGTVRFSPRGVSMLPMLRHGIDTVELASVHGKLAKYDLPLYRRTNGKYVLHRVVKVGDTYTCIGDNQYSYEEGICQDQIVAVVISFTRGERLYSVDDTGYKIYCRLWHYSRFPRRVLRAVKNRFVRLLSRRK